VSELWKAHQKELSVGLPLLCLILLYVICRCSSGKQTHVRCTRTYTDIYSTPASLLLSGWIVHGPPGANFLGID
jgi:hypothetical protein